jgi:hypothetical protein
MVGDPSGASARVAWLHAVRAVSEPSRDVAVRHDSLERAQVPASSTARVTFEGDVFAWADMPPKTQRLAQRHDAVLAELAVVDGALYGDPSDATRVLRAWRAHPGAVLIAVATQKVVIDGDRIRARGSFEHVSLRRYDAIVTPRRRAGSVPAHVDDAGAHAVPGPIDHESVTSAAARDAWRYLPSPVRHGAEKVVAHPEDWLGELRQRRDAGGQPQSQEVLVLRRSTTAAVVVVARRSAPARAGLTSEEVAHALAHTPWAVEQLTYDLREPALLGPAVVPSRAPWSTP